MDNNKIKKLLFSSVRTEFDEAIELNRVHKLYPKLNENAEKLWKGIQEVKSLAAPRGSIVFSETLWDVSLEEEDRIFAFMDFVELIQHIFPEYNDWPKVKRFGLEYLGIRQMMVIFYGDT